MHFPYSPVSSWFIPGRRMVYDVIDFSHPPGLFDTSNSTFRAGKGDAGFWRFSANFFSGGSLQTVWASIRRNKERMAYSSSNETTIIVETLMHVEADDVVDVWICCGMFLGYVNCYYFTLLKNNLKQLLNKF